LFNSYFSRIAGKLLKQNDGRNTSCQRPQLKINEHAETIFLSPVTEIGVEEVVKAHKGKLTAGFDEMPDYVVKQCTQFIK
jgi:hypothetical protein